MNNRSVLLLTLVGLAYGWVSEADAAKRLTEADLAKCEALLSGMKPGHAMDRHQQACLELLQRLEIQASAPDHALNNEPH